VSAVTGRPDALTAPIRALVEQRWPDQPWSSIDVYGFPGDDGDLAQVLLVTDHRRSACPVPTAWWLAVDDGVVVDERRHIGVEAEGCLAPDELSDGWWTGLSLPVPLDERQTSTVFAGGQAVELYNSDPDREALVAWSFGRFEAVGLDAPNVGQIVFEPSESCGEFSGVAHLETNGNTLYHCVHDIACGAPSCDRFTNVAKLSMLHELAHPWLEANLDQQQRQRLMDLTRTRIWEDRSSPWGDRGAEWAAEILAWGLLDTPMGLVRLGFPTCELRAQVFELLTGHEPVARCESTTS
jgi:hypothetical protein